MKLSENMKEKMKQHEETIDEPEWMIILRKLYEEALEEKERRRHAKTDV